MKGTLKKKSEIERLFDEGRRSSSSALLILMKRSTDEEDGACAFIAGKKLGTAPFRNRCKRVMREVARELGSPWKGYDIAFIARKNVATMDHHKVCSMMKKQLEELKVI